MKTYNYDLAVVGCGIAGSMAAIAAARHGIKVLARGLPQEMVDRLVKRGFSPGHTVDSTGYTYTVTPFSAEGMKRILEEMMLEAQVDILYHTTVYGVTKENGLLKSISCFSCGLTFEVSAKVFIDSTGDGDLLCLADVPFDSGRPVDGKDQPMTMNFKVDGVDSDRIRRIMDETPELFPFLCKKAGIEKNAVRLSVSGFQEIMKQGIREGKITCDRDIVLTFETDVHGEMIVNMSRINGESPINAVFLAVMMLLFYLCMTCYCTPYNALIPELGRTQKLRINVSTYISATYFIGTALAYTVPTIASMLFPTFGVAGGYRIAIAGLAVVAVICMLVPAFGIDEHKYADTTPSESPAFNSLVKTFKNKEFQTFVASDILYWVAFTMFQTGLLFYVTELMGLDVAWSTILLVLMMVVAFILYIPVNFLAKRIGKKKLIVFAFSFFAVTFGITALSGMLGVPLEAWGILIAVLASIPLAILGVLARTFAMKLGQAVSMLVFTGIIAMDIGDMKYRITAIVACAFCLLGALVFARYHEKVVLARIEEENRDLLAEEA